MAPVSTATAASPPNSPEPVARHSSQMGAGIASLIGRAFGLPRDHLRLIATVGAAAGIAAFNTPITAVLSSVRQRMGRFDCRIAWHQSAIRRHFGPLVKREKTAVRWCGQSSSDCPHPIRVAARMTCVFFVRRHEILRLEVHANEATREFALILKERDGCIRQNDFADATDLQRGWRQMENQLAEENWIRAGMPIVVPDRVKS